MPDRVIVITLSDEFRAAHVPDFRSRMNELIADGVRGVVVNMKHVAFTDSTGIACLIETQRRLRDLGAEIALSEVPARILKILNLLGVPQVLPVFPDDDAARAHFGTDGDDASGAPVA